MENTARKFDFVILIVDDEADLTAGLARHLKRRGFEVLCASSGNEAKGILLGLKKSPDAILTDIRMPNGDGIDLLKFVRGHYTYDKPVTICMSAFSDLSVEGAIQEGADALYPKPLALKELSEALLYLSEQRHNKIAAFLTKKAA